MALPDGTISFDHPQLAEQVERLSPEQVDALPFGAIRLNRDGVVTLYSAGERLQSGYRQDPLYKSFFVEVAPCFDTPHYRGRIEKAIESGRLNIEFTDALMFPGEPEEVEVRVRVQAGPSGASWIFTQRLD